METILAVFICLSCFSGLNEIENVDLQDNQSYYFVLAVVSNNGVSEIVTLSLSCEEIAKKKDIWRKIKSISSKIEQKHPEPQSGNAQDFIDWQDRVNRIKDRKLSCLLKKLYSGELVRFTFSNREDSVLKQGSIFQRIYIENELIEDGPVQVCHRSFYKNRLLN